MTHGFELSTFVRHQATKGKEELSDQSKTAEREAR